MNTLSSTEILIFFLVTAITAFIVLYLLYTLILHPIFSLIWYQFRDKARVYGLRGEGDDVKPFEQNYLLNSRRRVLDFSERGIVEVHGERISSLKRLRELTLSKNNLPSIDLSEFHNEGLERIDLSDNHLLSLELGSQAFTSLKHLDLSKNRLSGINVTDMLVFTALEELDLSRNRMASLDIGALTSCLSELTQLDLSGNQLEQISVGELQSPVSLTHLDLSDNLLTRLDLSDLLRMSSLKVLKIASCNTVELLADEGQIHHLEELDLSGTVLQQTDLQFLKYFPSLRSLRLTLSDLEVTGLDVLSGCSELEFLRLELDRTRVVSVDLTPLWSLKKLRRLEFTGFGQEFKVTPSEGVPPRPLKILMKQGGVQIGDSPPPVSPPKLFSDVPYVPIHLPHLDEMVKKSTEDLTSKRDCRKCLSNGVTDPQMVPESWFFTTRTSLLKLLPIVLLLAGSLTFILPTPVLLFVELLTFFAIYTSLVIVIFRLLAKIRVWWVLRYLLLLTGIGLEVWAYVSFLVEGGVFYDIGSFAIYLVDSAVVSLGYTVPTFLARTVDWLVWLTVAGSPLASFSLTGILLYLLLHSRVRAVSHHFVLRCPWCSIVRIAVLHRKKIYPLEISRT